jgi:hypothetical protein
MLAIAAMIAECLSSSLDLFDSIADYRDWQLTATMYRAGLCIVVFQFARCPICYQTLPIAPNT